MDLWLNGTRSAPEAARVSALNRGFLFGDGVFEVVYVAFGAPFRLPAHVSRLVASGDALGIDVSAHRDAIGAETKAVCESVRALPSAYLKIVVARAGSSMLDAQDEKDAPSEPATRLVFAREHQANEVARRDGIRAVTQPFRATAVPGAKTLSQAASVAARQAARKRGAEEAFAVDDYGNVVEGASSNVLAAFGKRIVAPAEGALEGITREAVLMLARERGYDIEARRLTTAELSRAEEVFITSSMRGLWPVIAVDGRPVGAGVPGPVARELGEAYQALLGRECAMP